MSNVDRIHQISHDELAEIDGFCEDGGLPRTDWLPVDAMTVYVMKDADGRLEATAKLERHGRRLFIEDLVVRSDLRGKGRGTDIVGAIVDDVRSSRSGPVWAMAKAVELFKGMGFEKDENKELLSEILVFCRKCGDYGKACRPELLRLDLH
jgi:N-acetylglutamate synthase-like GNAT family acetyltransferase